MLAPLYGAGLLLVEELAWRSIELRDIEAIGPGVITARVTAVLAVAAVGACAAAGAAIAVTLAPGRSVVFTAIGRSRWRPRSARSRVTRVAGSRTGVERPTRSADRRAPAIRERIMREIRTSADAR